MEEPADPFEEPAEEEEFEDPFLPVDQEEESVSDKAAFYQSDPAGGNPQPVAGTLTVGKTVTATITSGNEVKFYKFIPGTTGVYSLASSGEEDTYGYLYDANWQLITRNDDGTNDYNFAITTKLNANTTYYFGVGFYGDSRTGSFPITLKQLKTGWNQVGSDWYYIKDDGEYAKGWLQVGKTWYFFNEYDGRMFADGGYRTDGGTKLYFFKASGAWDNTAGWKTDSDGDKYYVGSSGQLLTGWQTIGGKKYYFDTYYGYMYRGVHSIDGQEYFFNNDGALGTKGWNKVVYSETWTDSVGNTHTETWTEWYYLETDGGMPITGWKKISGKWYYFDPYYNGRMVADRPYQVDGTRYYFTASGALAGAGWQKRVDNGYYSDGTAYSDTYWYYTDAAGIVQNGWKKIDGKWYYFSPEGGVMASGGRRLIDGKWYYFNASGAMQTGWIKDAGGYEDGGYKESWTDWYYANGSGVLQTGWQTIGGKTYYFDLTGCYMYADGVYYASVSDGEYHDTAPFFFTASGALAGAGWQSVKVTDNGVSRTFWFYTNADGTPVTGWKKIGGTWYYFNTVMYADGLFVVDGKSEYFQPSGAWAAAGAASGWQRSGEDMRYKENGKLVTGWKKIGGNWYYFDSSGNMKTGWVSSGGKWYYMSTSGAMQTDAVVSDHGNSYLLDKDGVWVTKTGWVKKSGSYKDSNYEESWTDWYYVESGGVLARGLRTIGGKLYYFGPSMLTNTYQEVDGVKYYFDANGVGQIYIE